MGSLPSSVLVHLFLKFLESGHFKFIIRKDSNPFCFIDNMLLIYPWKNNELNNIKPIISFMYEPKNNTLAFLKILLINNNSKIEF